MRLVKSTLDGVVDYIASTINKKLKSGQPVLWLLSGGSAAEVAVKASKMVEEKYTDKLTIGQIDERFGPISHKDSNWQQLMLGGLKTGRAKLIPALTGVDLTATVDKYIGILDNELSKDQYKLGLFGIGADSHTAGILPGSPAASAKGLISTYKGPDFERITLTPAAIKLLDEAVVYAAGESKKQVLENLQGAQNPKDQPAQFLKSIEKLTIFNDQIGGQL